MISFSPVQATEVAASHKRVSWLFKVVTDSSSDYWSTKNCTFATQPYSFKIIPKSFKGISMRRGQAEIGIQAPGDLKFSVSNPGNVLSAADFVEAAITVSLVINDVLIRAWKFAVKRCEPAYQQLDFICYDFLQAYLDGDYPNTPLIRDLFPSTDPVINDDLCVPVPCGSAYMPLRSVAIDTQRYYLLGPDAFAYTIDRVRSPRSFGEKSEWLSTGYTFTQSSHSDGSITWKLFQPIIADTDEDGVADAIGLWKNGESYVDMPVKFSRSDTAATINPADVIEFYLQEIGVLPAEIDSGAGSSFETAAATFNTWGLTFNGAFMSRRKRTVVLAELLNQCHATLVVGDTVKLKVLSKLTQATIGRGHILRKNDSGAGTFRYATILQRQYDSGYAAYQDSIESQDLLKKILVPVKNVTDNISSETLTFTMVQNDIHVQNLTALYYQRKFLRRGNVAFDAKSALLAYEPDDMVTVGHADYGGNKAVLIDSIAISPDLTLSFRCIEFKEALDDWEDFLFSAAPAATDVDLASWQPILTGPDGAASSGQMPNQMPGRLLLGTSGNKILLDPSEPVVEGTEGGLVRFRLGDLGINDYGMELWDAAGLSVCKIGTDISHVGGWLMSEDKLASATDGARVELNKAKNRISVFDDVGEKVAMGYLDGLAKTDGTGYWGVSDYGFWAKPGDKLSIDGDVEYVAGGWIIKNDGSLSIEDGFGRTIIRLGTDVGEKGLFLYDTTGTRLAKFVSDELFLGEEGSSLSYDPVNGMHLKGGVSVEGDNVSILITPTGGTAGNDYAELKNGQINFYSYFAGAHHLYKSLSRRATGTAVHGETVTLPGYWKTQPIVTLTPNSLQSFAAASVLYDQRQELIAGTVVETSAGSGVWQFPVSAKLKLNGNVQNRTKSYAENQRTNYPPDGQPDGYWYYTGNAPAIVDTTNQTTAAGTTTNLRFYGSGVFDHTNTNWYAIYDAYLTYTFQVSIDNGAWQTLWTSGSIRLGWANGGNVPFTFDKSFAVSSGSHTYKFRTSIQDNSTGYFNTGGTPLKRFQAGTVNIVETVGNADITADGTVNWLAIGD